MPTLNQRRAAEAVVKTIKSGEKIDGGDILENIGYSKSIAKNPKHIFQSKGFKEAIKELGFSIEAADLTIAKILRTGKEENQIKASQEIYKRLGAYEQGGGNTVNILVVPSNVIGRYNIKADDTGLNPSPEEDNGQQS